MSQNERHRYVNILVAIGECIEASSNIEPDVFNKHSLITLKKNLSIIRKYLYDIPYIIDCNYEMLGFIENLAFDNKEAELLLKKIKLWIK